MTDDRIAAVWLWSNGMVGVFGHDGAQIPDYQGPFADVRDALLRAAPPGVRFTYGIWRVRAARPLTREQFAAGAFLYDGDAPVGARVESGGYNSMDVTNPHNREEWQTAVTAADQALALPPEAQRYGIVNSERATEILTRGEQQGITPPTAGTTGGLGNQGTTTGGLNNTPRDTTGQSPR